MKTVNLIIGVGFVFFLGCKTDPNSSNSGDSENQMSESLWKEGQVVVTSQGMDFDVSDTLYSGWNTFEYRNESSEVHFVLLDLYPEGKNISHTKSEVLPPFNQGMKLIMEDSAQAAMDAFAKLPDWFYSVVYMGGTGLLSPGYTGKSTVFLKPGTYIMECYVKMFNGEWHTSHGMVKEIEVLETNTWGVPPKPSVVIEISSSEGIVVTDSILRGDQVFEVDFKDQKLYEHFVGHDVNLVQLEKEASVDSLLQWMNWMHPQGLRSPSPKGVIFLGGMNNLPAGSKGYFEVRLEPGFYALIAEVPEADTKKMFYRFEVR